MKKPEVVVALDYTDPYPAYALIDSVSDHINWFKVGPVLYTQSGAEVISYLHSKGKKILLDLKLFDTPHVVTDTVRQWGDLGVHYATVHTLGGEAMLSAASTGCRGSQLRLLGITLLTSQRARDMRQLGWEREEEEMVCSMVDLALEHRLSGILCSPHEIQSVTKRALPGFQVFTPGIRIPGEEIYNDDQQRVASPEQAAAWGADFLILGRHFMQAQHPEELARTLTQ